MLLTSCLRRARVGRAVAHAAHAACVAAAASAAPAVAQPAHPPTRAAGGPGGAAAGVTVWADSRFRGENATFRTPVPDLARFRMDGRIASLRVAGAQRWEGCEGANFTGRCQRFGGAESDLAERGWNRRLRSLRPSGGDVGGSAGGSGAVGSTAGTGSSIRAYGHSVYRGSPETFTAATPRARLGIVGSVRVRGRWEVCGAPDYRGACAVLDGDVPALGHALGLLTIRSLRPR